MYVNGVYMYNLDFKQIGLRIKEARMLNHRSQESLANAVDVNVSHISNIENNKVKVSLTLLVNICNELDVTVDYILQGEYHEPDNAIIREIIAHAKCLPPDRLEILWKIVNAL